MNKEKIITGSVLLVAFMLLVFVCKAAWQGTIDGVLNPSDIQGISVANIDSIIGVASSGPDLSALTNNLVAYHDMDETSGIRFDDFSTNDFGDVNTVGFTNGLISNAALFVLANGEHLISSSAALRPADADFAVNIWFRPETLAPNHAIVGQWSGGGSFIIYKMIAAAGYIGFIQNGAVAVRSVTSSVAAVTSSFQMITFNHDAANDLIFISVDGGAFVTNTTGGGLNTGSGDFRMCIDVGGTFCDGSIEAFARYDRILTTNDTALLFNGGAAIQASDLP